MIFESILHNQSCIKMESTQLTSETKTALKRSHVSLNRCYLYSRVIVMYICESAGVYVSVYNFDSFEYLMSFVCFEYKKKMHILFNGFNLNNFLTAHHAHTPKKKRKHHFMSLVGNLSEPVKFMLKIL